MLMSGKKVALFCAIFTLCSNHSLGLDISGYDEYKAALYDSSIAEIDLVDNITLTDELGSFASANLSIKGNGYKISSNDKTGLIVNRGKRLNLSDITFEKNSTAILNNGIIEKISNSSFKHNSQNNLQQGGAILNNGTINLIENTSFENNSAEEFSAYGGAVLSEGMTIIDKISNVSFKNNSISGTYAMGGALIGRTAYFGSIENTSFENNSAQGVSEASGGALVNHYGYLGYLKNVSFVNNSVSTTGDNSKAYGGALLNNNALHIGYFDNVSFIGNSANAQGEGSVANGGALANMSSVLNILSKTGETTFVGNSANGVSNAIVNNSTINFNAGKYNINVLDAITMEDKNSSFAGYSEININPKNNEIKLIDATSGQENKVFTAPSFGNVVLANKVDASSVNLYDGTLKLTFHKYTQKESPVLAGQTGVGYFTDRTNLNIYGGALSTMDNAIYHHHLGNVNLNSDVKMSVDADLQARKMDTISALTFNNNKHKIDVNHINLISSTTDKTLELSFIDKAKTDSLTFKNLSKSIVYTGGDIAYSPLQLYRVNFNDSTGKFKFDSIGVNPSVQTTVVAAQSGSLSTQIATFGEAFYNMDAYMSRDLNERITMRDRNKYASIYSQGMLWDDAITRRDSREAWFRPYVTFESVPLKNGPKVDNISYGSYFGTNSAIKQLKHGWDGAWGVYMGYNGSKQSYHNNNVYQNGGTIGVVGELYKKNFFTGLSVNTGASSGSAHTMYGTDNFTTLTAGVASKSGYNFEFKQGKYIVQPTVLLGYSFVNTFDYTNAAGVKITSEPIHSLHVEPGVRVIANLKNNWKPYVGVSMVWNLMDKAKFQADGYKLPETSIKPYVRYGVGVQKTWSDRLSSFVQAFVTNGGRNGVGLQAGISFLF